ncbi:metallophosphoesterase family protein [Candidatus Viridilinea mediisalina]|uniref:Metallophosphoesterase n=1 Tax=Candidatus Viridilinea mediisalina TaxID=2024553 RepID=A0A2A6RNW2_9CHLR|nr:metallophosphoesterase family protein [Candidatus Viridilinea mediisalina]PDW04625.1 metallophosphoesterase [Candidatus Viridilinea mediisalina]
MDKIAIIADIHGNLAALHAVIADLEVWSPDLVIVAGDTINRGPCSGACLELVLRMVAERGWLLLRGNHERYLLSYHRQYQQATLPQHGPDYELSRIIAWTHSQVHAWVDVLDALPDRLHVALDTDRLAVYHASIVHDRDGLVPMASDERLRAQIEPEAAIFCTAHTHVPFVRQLDQTLIVNVGAVGLPFDGDQRLAYARLTRGHKGWNATIMRLDYDVASAAQAIYSSGMFEHVGPLAELLLRELQTGHSLLFGFVANYRDPILAGQISFEDALSACLAQAHLAKRFA